MRSVIDECHRLSKAVEVYEFGSLSSEETVYIYGTLSSVLLHGCNDMAQCIKFANTALVNSRNLQEVVRPLDHGVIIDNLGTGNSKSAYHTSSNTAVDDDPSNRSSFKPQSALSSTEGIKSDAGHASLPVSTTPLSAALVFALLGSESLFDVFVNALDASSRVDSFDIGAVKRYRAACKDILRMQKHIARTVKIGECFAALSEVRIIRSITTSHDLLKKTRIAKVNRAKEIVEEHQTNVLLASISFEEALLEYITAEVKFLRSPINISTPDTQKQHRQSMRSKLDSIVSKFGKMGHIAKEQNAKQIVKQFMSWGKEGQLGKHLKMADEWFSDVRYDD